ncbi:hypothetical protein EON66_04795 [archaeon]|nr:MAG: hypothetical protein EON66_04795 [archaeon]
MMIVPPPTPPPRLRGVSTVTVTCCVCQQRAGNKLLYGEGQHKVMVVGGPNVRDDYHVEIGEVSGGVFPFTRVPCGEAPDVRCAAAAVPHVCRRYFIKWRATWC